MGLQACKFIGPRNKEENDEFTGTVFEPNYKANCNFWNDIKRSKEWKFGYKTETQVHLSDNSATIIPKAPIGDDKKMSVIWNAIIKFTQEDIPCPSDEPTGVFDVCIGIN